jgi:hypothetical protein
VEVGRTEHRQGIVDSKYSFPLALQPENEKSCVELNTLLAIQYLGGVLSFVLGNVGCHANSTIHQDFTAIVTSLPALSAVKG